MSITGSWSWEKDESVQRDKSLQSTENIHVCTSNYITSNAYVRADAESLKLKHKFFLGSSDKTNQGCLFKEWK